MKYLRLFILSVLLSGCHSSDPPAMPPVVVETQLVSLQAWQSKVEATATVMALQGTLLKAESAGRITQVAFAPGAMVAKDALLFTINPRNAQAQLKVQQAEAELAVENYKRALALYSQHVVSKADLDRAKATAKSDLATVEMAQATLDQAIVHAPFAGRMGLNLVQEGDYVTVGQALANLQQLDRLRVDFTVPEQYAAPLRLGDQVHITTGDALSYHGVISGLDSAIDRDTRLFAVRATIENPQQKLLPGAFVKVTVFYGPITPVVTVPQQAIVRASEGDKVYKVVAGKAVATPIVLGASINDRVIIRQGLHANDVVITAGQLKLHDGAPVQTQSGITHG